VPIGDIALAVYRTMQIIIGSEVSFFEPFFTIKMVCNPENMNQTVELLTLDLDTNRVIEIIKPLLKRLGLQALPSFDLRTVRCAPAGCACPYHGTEQCDCQMVVLLLYGAGEDPATLVVHGHNGKTFLSLVDTPNQRLKPELLTMIRRALLDKIPSRVD
jgi:hypothetical protein